MARLQFGGGVSDWTFSADVNGNATLAGGAQLTFWNAESGGTQYTDLQSVDGTALGAVVTTSTGSDGRSLAQIPPFLGPDGVYMMWASASGGPRAAMTATNLGVFFGSAVDRLNAHLDPTVKNPHATGVGNLIGVDMTGAAQGQILGIAASGLVVPLTVPGVSGMVSQSGTQDVTGQKRFINAASPAETRLLVQGASGQSVDVWQILNGGAVKTVWADLEGMLRARAAAADDVPLQVQAAAAQTADVFRVVDSAGASLFTVTAGGAARAAGLGRTVTFSRAGTPATGGAAGFRWYNDTGVTLAIKSVRANLGTAASAGSTRVDVNRDGTSLWTTTAAQPTLAAAANTSGAVTSMTTTSIAPGSYLTVDVDTVGTGAADLTVAVELAP